MRRKRKKKTSLRPRPILILLLILSVGLGIWFSPLTAIRKVRIEGALPSDQERLSQIALEIEGVPCIQIDPRIIESKVLELPEVKSASLGRNPISAVLRVTYRTPVARLQGAPDVALSSDGVLYPTVQDIQDLPLVQMASGGPPTLVTLVGTWSPQSVAKLAIESRKIAPSDVIRIQVMEGGVVWLNLGAGRISLGSLEGLDRKLTVLRERMATFPNELRDNEYLNLTDPDNPSLLPKRN